MDYVVFAVPEDLYDLCSTVDYTDATIGRVHQDLRRAFKVLAMKHDKATQIILNRTTTDEIVNRQVDHKSVRAWNLFTGLYFKVDGIPWAPCGLWIFPRLAMWALRFIDRGPVNLIFAPVLPKHLTTKGRDSCYEDANLSGMRKERDGHPTSPPEAAEELIDGVVQRYKQERKTFPRRIVIHKSSEFWPTEREGFMAGLKQVAQADMVALRPSSRVRLIREGLYPPLRGTAFHCGEVTFAFTQLAISNS